MDRLQALGDAHDLFLPAVVVDDRVGEDTLDVLARLAEGDQLDPDIGRKLLLREPAGDAVRSGIVGGSGQHRVLFQPLQHVGEIGGTQFDVDVGIGQVPAAGRALALEQLAGHVARGGRHQLHESHGAGMGAHRGIEGTLLADHTVDPGDVEIPLAGVGTHGLVVFEGESQLEVVPVPGTGEGEDGLVVPLPGLGDLGRGHDLLVGHAPGEEAPLATGIGPALQRNQLFCPQHPG